MKLENAVGVVSLAAALLMSGAVAAADKNPLLGRWVVKALPGDETYGAIQCVSIELLEFKAKTLRLTARTDFTKRPGDPEIVGTLGAMNNLVELAGVKTNPGGPRETVMRVEYTNEDTFGSPN